MLRDLFSVLGVPGLKEHRVAGLITDREPRTLRGFRGTELER
jgi:hypothetical protein